MDSGLQKIVADGIASLPKPLPRGDEARFRVDGAKGYTLAVLTGSKVGEAQFFPLEPSVVVSAAAQAAAPLARGVRLELARDPNQQGKLAVLKGVVVLGGGLAYTVAARPGVIPPVVAVAKQARGGLARALGLAFLGGILLNLMPCVFPVLFIKALSLVQSSREERGVMLGAWVGVCAGDSGFVLGGGWGAAGIASGGAAAWVGDFSSNRRFFWR